MLAEDDSTSPSVVVVTTSDTGSIMLSVEELSCVEAAVVDVIGNDSPMKI